MANRILIADGDVEGRSRVANELARRGHHVSCSSDALEVGRLLAAGDEGWDVVLTSLSVTGLSALELVWVVKDAWPQAEVIVVAKDHEHDAAVRCLAGGAFALLRHPYNLHEVNAVLARALERRELRASEANYQALRAVMGKAAAEKLPESIVRAWAAALRAERACLMVPARHDGSKLTVAYTWGDGPPLAPALLPAGADRSPAIVNRLEGAGALERVQRGAGIVFPLMQDQRLIAVLSAERYRPQFDANDLDRASILALHAKVALDNEMLVKHLVASDRLACLGQLAASIAHEIRTPLTWVLENAGHLVDQLHRMQQAASEQGIHGQARRAAADVIEGANRIRDIVRDIGALASPDETTRAPFDVKEAVRAALRMSEPELRGRAKVILRLDEDTQIIGSVGRISQVFVNLLVNAAQAIATEGAREGKIIVVLRREGPRVVAEVADDGPGMPPDVLQHVFEPFFTTKSPAEGTGLGLFLSRDAVRRHGGELRVRSNQKRGTTFVVDLPADPVQPVRGKTAAEPANEDAPGDDKHHLH